MTSSAGGVGALHRFDKRERRRTCPGRRLAISASRCPTTFRSGGARRREVLRDEARRSSKVAETADAHISAVR